MKKAIALFAVAMLVIPAMASAATIFGGQRYTVKTDKIVEGDLYAAAGTVNVSGTITGDAVIASGTMNVTGSIGSDLTAAGGTIAVSGTIGDDVRAAGGNIDISTTIPGDLVIAGGDIAVTEDAIIEGDVIAGGGNVTIRGTVKGNITGGGGTVTLGSTIGGNVDLKVRKLVLEDGAAITGNLTYESEDRIDVPEGAVTGTVTFREARWNYFGFSLIAVPIIIWFMNMIGMLLFALILVLIYPSFSQQVLDRGAGKFWLSALYGFAFLVLVPIAAVLLFLSVVGWVVALALLAIYGLFFIFAAAYGAVLLGSVVLRLLKQSNQKPWAIALLGTVLTTLIGLVPFLGWLVVFIFFLAGLGAFSIVDWEKLRRG